MENRYAIGRKKTAAGRKSVMIVLSLVFGLLGYYVQVTWIWPSYAHEYGHLFAAVATGGGGKIISSSLCQVYGGIPSVIRFWGPFGNVFFYAAIAYLFFELRWWVLVGFTYGLAAGGYIKSMSSTDYLTINRVLFHLASVWTLGGVVIAALLRRAYAAECRIKKNEGSVGERSKVRLSQSRDKTGRPGARQKSTGSSAAARTRWTYG